MFSPMKNHFLISFRILYLFIVLIIFRTNAASADNPCSMLLMRVTYYTTAGNVGSGYLQFELPYHWVENYEYAHDYGPMVFNAIHYFYGDEWEIFPKIPIDRIDFSKIPDFDTTLKETIFAVNKTVLSDTLFPLSQPEYDFKPKSMVPIADTLYTIPYQDSLRPNYHYDLYYSNPGTVHFDTINLLLLDTMMWCADYNQVQWVDSIQAEKLRFDDLVFQYTFEGGTYTFIDFYCYDAGWTPNKIEGMLEPGKLIPYLDTSNHYKDIMQLFPPALRKAIQANEIIYFVRWCP